MSTSSFYKGNFVPWHTTASQAFTNTGLSYNCNFTGLVNTSEEIDPGKRKRAEENSYLYDNQGITFEDQPSLDDEVRRKRQRVANASSCNMKATYGVYNGGTNSSSINHMARSGTVQSLRGRPGLSKTASKNAYSPLQNSASQPQVSPRSHQIPVQSFTLRHSDATTGNTCPPQNSNSGERVHPDILSLDESEAMLNSITATDLHACPQNKAIGHRPIHHPQRVRHDMVSISNLQSGGNSPYLGNNQLRQISGPNIVPRASNYERPTAVQNPAAYNRLPGSQALGADADHRISPSCTREQPATIKRRAGHDTHVAPQPSQMTFDGFCRPSLEQGPDAKRRRAAKGTPALVQAPPASVYHAPLSRSEKNQSATSHQQSGSSTRTAGRSLRASSDDPLLSSWEQVQPATGYDTAGLDTILPSTEGFVSPPSFLPPIDSAQDYLTDQPARASDPDFDFDAVQDQYFARYSSPPLTASRSSTPPVRSRLDTRIEDFGHGHTTAPHPTATTLFDFVGVPSIRRPEQASHLGLRRPSRRTHSGPVSNEITEDQYQEWLQRHEL